MNRFVRWAVEIWVSLIVRLAIWVVYPAFVWVVYFAQIANGIRDFRENGKTCPFLGGKNEKTNP